MIRKALAWRPAFALPVGRRSGGRRRHRSHAACQRRPDDRGSGRRSPRTTTAAHPGVKVDRQYLENEAYKAKLTTLLQSDGQAEHHLQLGRRRHARADRGRLHRGHHARRRPTSKDRLAGGGERLSPSTASSTACPSTSARSASSTTRTLFAKAGVDPASIKTWDGFLAAVKKLKAAGITPIVMGGGEKWPMHFYWSYLRHAHRRPDVFEDAEAGKDGGFKDTAFVEAGKKLKELADLQPFQEGWLGTTLSGLGGPVRRRQGRDRADGQLAPRHAEGERRRREGHSPTTDSALLPFPTIAGGKGNLTDTLGGISGWLVTKGSPPEALDFLQVLRDAGARRRRPPRAASTSRRSRAPTRSSRTRSSPRSPSDIAASTWHQIFFDQDLGPAVGRVVNDMSVAIAAGESRRKTRPRRSRTPGTPTLA